MNSQLKLELELFKPEPSWPVDMSDENFLSVLLLFGKEFSYLLFSNWKVSRFFRQKARCPEIFYSVSHKKRLRAHSAVSALFTHLRHGLLSLVLHSFHKPCKRKQDMTIHLILFFFTMICLTFLCLCSLSKLCRCPPRSITTSTTWTSRPLSPRNRTKLYSSK